MTSVELERDVLASNDGRAARLRSRFSRSGVEVVNVLSSPGSGKTALMTAVLAHLVDNGVRAAAIVGDCATDNDARRLAESGAPVVQVVTDGNCHLEADMVAEHLQLLEAREGVALEDLDVLVIENVGNLVCPAGFDLGESQRLVLLSVTEGEDKPRKYPAAFSSADIVVLTKLDLAGPCDFDEAAALASIASVAGPVLVARTSARTGLGVDDLAARMRPVPVG